MGILNGCFRILDSYCKIENNEFGPSFVIKILGKKKYVSLYEILKEFFSRVYIPPKRHLFLRVGKNRNSNRYSLYLNLFGLDSAGKN